MEGPPPGRERAADYASVAVTVLALALVPIEIRAIAAKLARAADPQDPITTDERIRFKLWVNAQPGLPYIY